MFIHNIKLEIFTSKFVKMFINISILTRLDQTLQTSAVQQADMLGLRFRLKRTVLYNYGNIIWADMSMAANHT